MKIYELAHMQKTRIQYTAKNETWGIYGCGDTLQEAITMFETEYKKVFTETNLEIDMNFEVTLIPVTLSEEF